MEGVFSLIAIVSKRVLEPTQPPTQWVLEVITPGIKWPGREADQLAASNAEDKNARCYTFTSQYVLMTRHTDKCTFIFQRHILYKEVNLNPTYTRAI